MVCTDYLKTKWLRVVNVVVAVVVAVASKGGQALNLPALRNEPHQKQPDKEWQSMKYKSKATIVNRIQDDTPRPKIEEEEDVAHSRTLVAHT